MLRIVTIALASLVLASCAVCYSPSACHGMTNHDALVLGQVIGSAK